MAVNKPVGDNAGKSAVRKRSQIKIKLLGRDAWTKRNKKGGEFMAVKKSKKKNRGVRREKKAAQPAAVFKRKRPPTEADISRRSPWTVAVVAAEPLSCRASRPM
jgi:hypothetical protein